MMIFLKLGGSLITEKAGTQQARGPAIQRLSAEIARAYDANPRMKLVLGHGSGSFGHAVAQHYGTHRGARTPEDWHGFDQVWAAANSLHRILLDALRGEGISVRSFPPSSLAIAQDGHIIDFMIEPLSMALDNGQLPVVYGDVVFDLTLGAAIVSTEQVLAFLAERLHPQRLLLAGREPGLLDGEGNLLPELRQQDLPGISFFEPAGADVTGGMRSKVEQALTLKEILPGLEILIFGADIPGTLREVLLGGSSGTTIVKS